MKHSARQCVRDFVASPITSSVTNLVGNFILNPVSESIKEMNDVK